MLMGAEREGGEVGWGQEYDNGGFMRNLMEKKVIWLSRRAVELIHSPQSNEKTHSPTISRSVFVLIDSCAAASNN